MAACGTYEVIREFEEIIVKIDCEECPFFPSIEDDGRAMALVVEVLEKVGEATKIVLVQRRDYEYDTPQTQMLLELALLHKAFLKEKPGWGFFTAPECGRWLDRLYNELNDLLYGTLKSDPIGAYVQLLRIARREKEAIEILGRATQAGACVSRAIPILDSLIKRLEATKLIAAAKPFLPGYRIGEREIYGRIFAPTIRPDFMFTRLMAAYPREAEELAAYKVNETEVTIFALPDTIQYLYHIVPPEFRLSEEKYELLDAARRILAEHKPSRTEFVDPERMRYVFYTIASDMLDELAELRGLRLRTAEREQLANILVRYTVGFGLIEILLEDDKIQDITINSPLGRIPIFLIHQDFGDCFTNILPTYAESEGWATKLRLISGRPLDEANPILDTEITLPKARARVAAIAPPLNPTGLAFALRRHRDMPWTLPLFIKFRMLNPLAAGILSFIIDGNRTLLVAGTRSAGKTSLLGSLIAEISRRGRIITIEDTLELPVSAYRNLNYNIQSMKVAAALLRGTTEVSADEGIRSTLRLGDSSLVVGEIRSVEARALYEAMRIGALANVVMGTVHADSPYGVFDRVVNDLGVPRTSFKATDIVVVANPVRSPDGIHRWRRVTSIAEVRKFWEEDPLREGGFVDLMRYDAKTDTLVPTPDLLAGDSDIIKAIAGNVREWAGNWTAVWENINLRAKIKSTLVDYAERTKIKALLEAPFVVKANDEFRRISESVREEIGYLDSTRIFSAWEDWLKKSIKQF